MIKISIIVPLYNKAAHIMRAIDSVFAQTEQNFEIIVVNDASTDGGEKLIQSIADSRVKLFHRDEPGPGGHAARNKGIKEASASLISFLDADDIYNEHFLETILRLKCNFPEAGIFSTAYEIIDEYGRLRKLKFKAIPLFPWEGILPNYFESTLGEPPVWTSATAIPRKVFDDVGNFPEGEKMGGDLDMWLRVALKYSVSFSNVIGARYYKDSLNRICPTEYSISEYKFVKTARKAMINNKLSNKDKLCLTEYINMKEIERANRCVVIGNKNEARKILREINTCYFKKEKASVFFLIFLPSGVIKLLRFLKRKIIRCV